MNIAEKIHKKLNPQGLRADQTIYHNTTNPTSLYHPWYTAQHAVEEWNGHCE